MKLPPMRGRLDSDLNALLAFRPAEGGCLRRRLGGEHASHGIKIKKPPQGEVVDQCRHETSTPQESGLRLRRCDDLQHRLHDSQIRAGGKRII